MSEKKIDLENIDLLILFGSNNSKLYKIKDHFPNLKLVARGNKLKVLGTTSQISFFEEKFTSLLNHVDKYNRLTITQIEEIMLDHSLDNDNLLSQIIVHGVNGKSIKARTVNQQKMVGQILDNDMMFAVGPAGTGKTYTAVALAVRALKSKQVKKIILTRPAVEAGENLGFLPGDLKEKLDPYMQPLYDALTDMIPSEKQMEAR